MFLPTVVILLPSIPYPHKVRPRKREEHGKGQNTINSILACLLRT